MSRRESHDASAYYDRSLFTADVTADETVAWRSCPRDEMWCHSSETMGELPDNSVALMVTSPEYHVGKEYEDLAQTADEYFAVLERVFRETYRVLEPGGRAVVNVANLGRKPYVFLSDAVAAIMRDVGFLPRGEIIWIKAAGAAGSAAFGSFCKPSNPVLRDLHEYLLVFSKGRFDRAIKPARRKLLDLPHEATITKDEFLTYTLSTWNVRPESAKRVGHPAPFPVEIPARFIKLFTYAGDVVLDPFIGVGSTAVAARQLGRYFVGYDLVDGYLDAARARVKRAGDPVIVDRHDPALVVAGGTFCAVTDGPHTCTLGPGHPCATRMHRCACRAEWDRCGVCDQEFEDEIELELHEKDCEHNTAEVV